MHRFYPLIDPTFSRPACGARLMRIICCTENSMKHSIPLLVCVSVLTVLTRNATGQPQMLVQVQAADVLSDLLTWTVDRANARVNAMSAFLNQIGKKAAYEQNKPPVRGKSMFFTQVFNGAVDFIKNGGAKYADPALSNLNDSQLMDHFNTLQAYNMQQFIQLNQLRDQSNSMAAYLESVGQFDDYLKWAKAKFPGVSATAPPAPQTPEQEAAQMQKVIDTVRDVTWKKAQAMGMSQADFDQRWNQMAAQYRESVAKKVEGIQATGSWLTKSELAQSTPAPAPAQPPVVWQSGPPVKQAQPTLPAPVQSQYTSAYYSGVDSQIDFWDGWNDGYWDVGGGGHHH